MTTQGGTTTLDDPLEAVLGVQPAAALAKHLELHTVRDLLYHVPRRYDERGEHTDISALRVGEEATVLAQVLRVSQRPLRQRRGSLLEVTVADSDGATLTCTFFNQAWRQRTLTQGRWGLFAGRVGEFQQRRQLTNPEYILLGEDGESTDEQIEQFAGAFIPLYPATAAVRTWVISKHVRTVLDRLSPPADPLPAEIRVRRNLLPLDAALRMIHQPDSWGALGVARKRLAWDEAFAVQLTLVQRRARAALWPATPRPRRPDGILAAFDQSLPYELTEGQHRVGEEIAGDLARPHPMHRLLQGEVGSGKTVCALRAMLQVVDAGGQAVLLAPTEVLAAQHWRGITDLLGPLGRADQVDGDPRGTTVALVTGSQTAAARRTSRAAVASGVAGIVVGTHALLYDGVDFADLGLVVVDEQHRFGVEQRDALRAKAAQPPHVLVMTATPIPRTVAMTVFGDLDTSVLSQLPRGRSPIASHVVPVLEKPAYLDRAWRRLREEVDAGHQAYVVCPRIGGDDRSEGRPAGASGEDEVPPDPAEDSGADLDGQRRAPLAVVEVAESLLEIPAVRGLRVGVLHGRLPAEEKDAVMRSFAAGELDVLVATTVIEVGVDVPNATMMMVLDADRFGVSQLHQLRGRVGRGRAAGLCLLVTEAPEGSPARERLDAVASTTDGFRLAELDLEQRREGDVLGATQSGRRSHLRLLSLLRDAELIRDARADAEALVAEDPDLGAYPLLARAVAELVDQERAEYLDKG